MDEYNIRLDRHVLKQLGAQLYGDTPSVIAELVANSYDADAKNVWITVDPQKNDVFVEDDGKGMTATDINDSFLNIGYDKRADGGTTILGRKIMGRKGIGKLAAFSLTNLVVVCSSKDGQKCGCVLDFKKITEENQEPDALDPDKITFDADKLSISGSGTRIELCGVKKRVALSYRFIVNKLIRSFDVNDDNFAIHIKQSGNEYKTLHRSELNFFSIMDTILVIGDEHSDKLKTVLENQIPLKYKSCTTYNLYLKNQKAQKNRLTAFPYKIDVEDAFGNETKANFTLNGWIGTISTLPDLRKLSNSLFEEDEVEEDRITINDNRVSLYSRGKLGEYDILAKIKNNRNSEAYVIGEVFVDIFEDNELSDMAISNRRGYEEGDSRYIETVRIIKRLLGYIVGEKDKVAKQRKLDEEMAETDEIKKKLLYHNKTREILKKNLSVEERTIVQEENLQFTRAVTNSKATKKIFISHSTRLKLYGQFIVDVLENYGVDVCSSIIFTSDRRLGVPQGRDIYDYLKECFREELMVIFLFSKAFYDSNVCISEAGAAWATNQNCLNIVIDIDFDDVEKPSNNALSSIRFANFHADDQVISLLDFFSTIITKGLGFAVDETKLKNSIQKLINSEKYADEKINSPDVFFPTRKFLPQPLCEKCSNIMKLKQSEGKVFFECTNVSCKNTILVTME